MKNNIKNRILILGIPVDKVTMSEAVDCFAGIMSRADGRGCAQIVTPNAEIVYSASKNQALEEAITAAELVIPDGIGLVYASRIMGTPLSERVTGIDFLTKTSKWLSKHSGAVYLFGSAPGVAEKAAKNLVNAYPGLRIAGLHHGFYRADEEDDIVSSINASGADFLCVALGAPKQELFIHRHKDALNVKAAMGVGGSLDVWAGVVDRAPESWRKSGFEWLYRLLRQPKRIGRMGALPLFLLKVIAERLSRS